MRHVGRVFKLAVMVLALAGQAAAQQSTSPSSLERVAMPDGGRFGFLEQEETRELYRQAFIRLSPGPNHNPAGAVELARKALALEPDNPKGHLLYAEVKVRAGSVEEGISFLKDLITKNPAENSYRTALAQVYFSQRRDDEAYRFLEEEIAAQPDDVVIRAFRGESRLFVTGDFALAEADFHVLVEKSPEDPRLWTSLGFARFQQGKLMSAREAFRKALVLDPEFVEARNNLAWVDHKEKKFEEALRAFDAVLAGHPDYRPAHLGRAYTLRDMGDLRGSIQSYKKLIEIDPNFVLVLDMLVLYVRLYQWFLYALIAAGLVWFGRLYLRTIRRDRRKAERALERR